LVYKYQGCLHDNIDNEIIDGSAIVSMELGSQKPWMKTHDWCKVRKVQG
jgi:hypothetical protein